MLGVNKIESVNKEVNEIIDDLLIKRNCKIPKIINNNLKNMTVHSELNSFLISTNYSDYREIIRKSTIRNKSFSNLSDIKNLKISDFKKKSFKDRLNDFTYSLYSPKHNRMDKKENKIYENINPLNYRYQDANINNYILNYLPRFKKIYKYKNKVEKILLGGDKFLDKDKTFDENQNKFSVKNLKTINVNKNQSKNNNNPNNIFPVHNLNNEIKVNKLNVYLKLNEYKSYIKTCLKN